MAITISSIDVLKQYFDGVVRRSDHHANNVNEIIFALIGGVIWRSTDDVRVREYAGSPANILWMTVGSHQYCFVFNHSTGDVEVKKDKHNGATIRAFNNATPLVDVKSFFEQL